MCKFGDMKKVILLLSVLVCMGVQVPGVVSAQGIQAGPWISDMSENRMTVLWTSEVPGTAFVELEDGRTFYDTFAGRRIFRRLHSITVDGLQPGQVVKYRLHGENIEDDTNARDPKFGTSYIGPWEQVKTFDYEAETCRFSVFNDIHMKTGKYEKLAAQVDSAATDFLFLNGDIVSAGNYVLDTLVRYAVEPIGPLTHGLPLLFARGNHEGRGNNTWLVADVFPHADPAPFYYTFRQGPVAFVVFDGGETHDDRCMHYAGAAVFEDYLAEQIAWASKALKEEAFQSAPVKICLIHVPMIDHEDKTDFLLQRWLNVHMVPMLNEAGIDLMIGADLHEFMFCDTGTMGNDFPILVNDDVRRLDVECGADHRLHVRMFNAKGKVEFERWIPGEEHYVQQGYKQLTVKEFLRLSSSDTESYAVTGVVDKIRSTSSGSFYLKDKTGTLLVYGIQDPSDPAKSFKQMDIEKGDTLTVLGRFTIYGGTTREMKDGRLLAKANGPEHNLSFYDRLDQQPTFKGKAGREGLEAFRNWVIGQIPADAPRGTVTVKFVIGRKGNVQEVQFGKVGSPALAAEVETIVKRSPKWKPAIAYGSPVRMPYTLTITH